MDFLSFYLIVFTCIVLILVHYKVSSYIIVAKSKSCFCDFLLFVPGSHTTFQTLDFVSVLPDCVNLFCVSLITDHCYYVHAFCFVILKCFIFCNVLCLTLVLVPHADYGL